MGTDRPSSIIRSPFLHSASTLAYARNVAASVKGTVWGYVGGDYSLWLNIKQGAESLTLPAPWLELCDFMLNY